MRSADTTRRDVLRFLRSEIHNVEIDRGRPLTDDEITTTILRQIEQRRESIKMFERGNRTDLIEREEQGIEILKEYLPPELTAEELAALAREVVQELNATGPRDLGRVIPALRERVGARAEPSAIAEAAKSAVGVGRRGTGAM